MSMAVVRVAVVDDQDLVRDGIAAILAAQPDLEVVLTAAHGQALLDSPGLDRVDVVLLDLRMPVLDGLATLPLLLTRPHPPRVLVVTTFAEDELVVRAITAGASGYVLKRATGHDLARAVRDVAAGRSVLSPQVTGAVLTRMRQGEQAGGAPPSGLDYLASLTGREVEVHHLIGQGLTNAEIAASLQLSMSTVKTHVMNVLAKSGARDRVQLALWAHRS